MPVNAKHARPKTCEGCVLEHSGVGFVPPSGPTSAKILLYASHNGYSEVAVGRPMSGSAGGMLTRICNANTWSREQFRIHSALSCCPPGAEIQKKWFRQAHDHCAIHRDYVLKQHPVIVAMGGDAIRSLLGLWDNKHFSVDDFHGTVTLLPSGQQVVATYHPSHLQQGAHNLFQIVSFDLQVAHEVARGEWQRDPITPIIDPPVEWYRQYADNFLAFARQNPDDAWLGCDMETPDTRGRSEATLGEDDRSYKILRDNFACNGEEGVTVPHEGPYREITKRLIEEAPVTLWWNCPTPDQKILTADLRWVEAGSLKVGDRLVGFDEEPQTGRRTRRYRESIVTYAERRRAPVYAVALSNGRVVKTTAEHPWLAVKPTGEKRRTMQWIKTSELIEGQTLQPLFDIWEEGTDWRSGYLAGFLDGEGSLSVQKPSNTMILGFSQAGGLVLDHTLALLDSLGVRHGCHFPGRAKDSHVARVQIRGRTADVAALLGHVRPRRLLPKFQPEKLGALQTLRTQDVTVIAVTPLGVQEIVGLSTSTHTYVLEGFGAHNCNYDLPRYKKAGIEPKLSYARKMQLDGMWLCKYLQSDVPMGLGFWAPLYSRHGAWKHLAGSAPGEYAAYDGPQTFRTVSGICADLVSTGKWEIAHRHSVRLMEHILKPATEIGIQVDRVKLDAFEADLTTKARALLHRIQPLVPQAQLNLTPKGGLAHPPKRDVHAKGTQFTVKGELKAEADRMDPLKLELYAEFAEVVEVQEPRTVLVCRICNAVDVVKVHRCDKKRERDLVLEDRVLPRWYWREPFNPDSSDQWLAYIRSRGHKPGRNKKTKNAAADRETLQRLARTTGDPVYQLGLDLRAVVKVRGTYAIGVRRRLDEHNRFHPQATLRPSMYRNSYQAPNIQNCLIEGTLIEVLRDCAQFPKGIPIEQVRPGDWAYCFDDERRLTLRQVTGVIANGWRPVVRIHWKSARKRPQGWLDLTADHRVRLVDGSYVEARYLKPGDRILSLARCSVDYEYLYATGHRQLREHAFVWRTLHGTKAPHVHHENENPHDNRPGNLAGLEVGEHFRLHNTGAGNPRWNPSSPHHQRAQRHNHEVVAIESLLGVFPVWDLSIDELHNFIASELCVHNCVSDKGGKDSLAAGFRKCIIGSTAPPSWWDQLTAEQQAEYLVDG